MRVGWVDFSAQERSRTLTVLGSLSQPGAVDELGIGIVRDAIADTLFPSTSTLLTKARYFFLVPYISRFMEEGRDAERRDPRALAEDYSNHERACAEGLLRCSDSTEGIIGRVALSGGRWVTRGPGELYWAPLRSLGFMRSGAPTSYFGQFVYLADARLRDRRPAYEKNDENDDGLADDPRSFRSMWNLPRSEYAAWKDDWKSWKTNASIVLTQEEAVFLRKRIVTSYPSSLYSLLLTDEATRTLALATLDGGGEAAGDSGFHAFLRNGALERINAVSPQLARTCALADAFSEMVYGCRIAYNMQLSGLVERGGDEWDEYSLRAPEVAGRVDLPGIAATFGLLGHSGFALVCKFMGRAIAHMQNGDLEGLQLEVRKREASIKGARRKIGREDQAEYAWRGGRRLPYRFANAMGIVREICEAGGCDA